MKARIKQNGLFGGIWSDDWIENNKNFIVNNELVLNWVLTDVLPEESIKKPIWNGLSWDEDYNDEDLRNEIIKENEFNKQIAFDEFNKKIILDTSQDLDDNESLDSQSLFPLWDGNSFDYTLDFKCQHFTAENELVLYKCVQAHTSQSNWNPENVPALFARVAYPNEIPVFIQPTGAQDAYQTGDQVYFPTAQDDVYESLIDDNVWSPISYPQGWQLIQ